MSWSERETTPSRIVACEHQVLKKVSLQVLSRRKYVNGALQKKRANANRSAAIGARKHLTADDGWDDCVGVGGGLGGFRLRNR